MLLPKLRVLFLCTGNSCRSQMAEAWSRELHGDRLDPHSAGTSPKPVDPRAIEVMKEVGIDIGGQRSKSVDELAGTRFDAVVTVCDRAHEMCPAFPGSVVMHVTFDDPPRLAEGLPIEEARIVYRRVRDEIRVMIEHLPATLALIRRVPDPAGEPDRTSVLELLRSTDLPTSGVEDFFPDAYSVLRVGSDIVAVAGLESHGSAGLLRSVAVAATHRGLGLGQRMVEERMAFAKRKNLDAVYLLTTTAAHFFRKLGFEPVARPAVPAELQASSEFSSVCPTTAACLVKRLSP